jgi:hypothetical protein
METAPTIEMTPAMRRLAMLKAPDYFGSAVSGGVWKRYTHLTYIARRIAEAVQAKDGRLIINMPPGFGKSEMLSWLTPAWLLEKDPTQRVLLAMWGADIAATYGRKVRNTFIDNPLLETRLSDDSKANNRWHTPQGGGMTCVGIGGGVTGKRGDLLLVDDPYGNIADAFSETYRRGMEDWWDGTFRNRAMPGATFVVLHHRLHPDDLTGFLSKKTGENWEVIRLPALAEANDQMKRQPGASLWPEMWTRDAIERVRLAESGGESRFRALFQQDPQGVVSGNIYGQFGEYNIADGDPLAMLSPLSPLCLALDFNINPGMHGLVGQYDSIADRFHVAHELHAARMSLPECMDAFVRWHAASGGKWPEVWVYGDASGGSGSAATGAVSCYDIIRDRLGRAGIRYRVKVPGSNPAVVDRLAAVNDALRDAAGVPRVRVHRSCERLLTDFREMRSGADGAPLKADRRLSHASDAFGYWTIYVRPVGGGIRIPRGRMVFGRPSMV